MGDSTLTLILAFVAGQVAQLLAFARFYLELKKGLKVSVKQIEQQVITLNELRDMLEGSSTPAKKKGAAKSPRATAPKEYQVVAKEIP